MKNKIPDYTFGEWIKLPMEQRVEWWLLKVGLENNKENRKKLTHILKIDEKRSNNS